MTKEIRFDDEKSLPLDPNPNKSIKVRMKISPTHNFRNALIGLFCICAFLAKTADAAAVTSNLNLQGIRNVVVESSQSAALQGLGAFDPAEQAMSGNSHTAALPSLAMLAPSPEWSAIFPIIGLIAAVAVTQLLRRRRIAQLRSSSLSGQ